jgi:hypothetical protein
MDELDDQPQDALHPARLRRDLRDAIKTTALFPKHGAYAVTGVFCPACSVERRMLIHLLYFEDVNGYGVSGSSLCDVTCLQCEMSGVAVLYEGPEGDMVAVHWPKQGGLSTPNTPKGVAYYLDQAARCETAGASSAAVAMYRAALDHLMFDHGYKKGMLGVRLGAMISDAAAGTGPKWVRDIDHAYFDAIKKLGDGAIHTNDGDVSKQASLDDEVIAGLHVAFTQILEVVYERPAKDSARLAKLQKAASALKK